VCAAHVILHAGPRGADRRALTPPGHQGGIHLCSITIRFNLIFSQAAICRDHADESFALRAWLEAVPEMTRRVLRVARETESLLTAFAVLLRH
jgi:hypothetical protein